MGGSLGGHDHMKEQVKPLFCDIWHGPFSRCCSWASCYTIWCILVLWLSYGLHLNFPEVPTLWLKCGQRYAILMRVAPNVISYLCHMGHIIDSERHILKAISFKFEMINLSTFNSWGVILHVNNQSFLKWTHTKSYMWPIWHIELKNTYMTFKSPIINLLT